MIVGLDLAYSEKHGIGFSRYNGEFETFLINPPSGKLPLWKRFEGILKSILREISSEDIIFIEDYAYAQNSQSEAHLKELGGLVRWFVWKKTGGWPIAINPGTLKKYATGKGNTKKNLILLEVFANFGEKFDDDNKADAYCLARLGSDVVIPDRALPKFRQECVQKVLSGLHQEQIDFIEKIRNSSKF